MAHLLPRVLAGILALGGAAWGVLLLWLFGAFALFPLPFGVGYALTAGYAIRATSTPSLAARRAGWCVSLTVQGAWLAADLAGGALRDLSKPILLVWWAFATVASAVALVCERAERVPT